jgi:hypothetical protein
MNALLLAALCLLCATPAAAAEYGYPIRDPYLATVVGTPPALRAPLPERIRISERSLELFPERELSTVFWAQKKFRYSVALQEDPAPLVFVIAGTGASFDSGKMVFLQKVLYGEGWSVVNISSPTQSTFIVTASESAVPGFMDADVRDLYQVMKRIREDLADRVEVTRYLLTGYSLGGTQAAFLGELDEREGAFGFERILLLNPSVNLYTSVNLLDDMVRRSIPGGAADFKVIVNDLLSRVARYFASEERDAIDAELLYRIADNEELSRRELEALIGVAFRISLANLLFSSDVINQSGHVSAADTDFSAGTPLLPYLKVAGRWSFTNYLGEVLLPYWSARQPELTRELLIHKDGLPAIEDYLRRSYHVGVLTNADELILVPEDHEFLARTFGSRLTTYPRGGHCGNLEYRQTIEDMLLFLRTTTVRPDPQGSAE